MLPAPNVSTTVLAGMLFSSTTLTSRGISSFHLLKAVPFQTCQLLCHSRFRNLSWNKLQLLHRLTFLYIFRFTIKFTNKTRLCDYFLCTESCFYLITGKVHKLHPEQILPCSSLSHLQPSLHARLHFATQLPASPFRRQPPLQFAPFANFNAPPSTIHSSPVLHLPSHVHTTSKQSPAPCQREPGLRTAVSNWLPSSSTSGSAPM